jgi:hypothetical protein
MASIFRIIFINPSDLKRIATTETFSYPKKVTTQKTNVLKFKSTPSPSKNRLKFMQPLEIFTKLK